MSDLGINAGAIRMAPPAAPAPEQVLILGWNWRTPTIINELEHYIAPGSMVTVVADFAAGEAEIARHCMETTKQAITFQQGDTTDRRTLDRLPSARYWTFAIGTWPKSRGPTISWSVTDWSA